MFRPAAIFALTVLATFFCLATQAKILWSDLDARTVHNSGAGLDILGGAVQRSNTNNDALYFMVHVDPLSDVAAEPYFAGFQLFEGDEPRLGVGNAMEAWGYSAFNTAETGPSNSPAYPGEFNLKSAHPEPINLGLFRPYELVRQGVERTILFKVQYVPGGDDQVTVWLDPKLGRGDTERNQPENITTKFPANASFNQIRLRQGPGAKGDGGNGWIFSDMAIATSFNDFVVVKFWQTWWFVTFAGLALLFGVGATVRLVEQKKFQRQLQRAEAERALERERARIARDLHDELGSQLTRISLLSGLLCADRDQPGLVETHAGKISLSADQTVRALEEIVWAVRPDSDTLQSLIDYLTHFAGELFEGSRTRCRLDLPHDLPALPLPPEMRHNIFLIIKEALTNTLKHAGAKEVHVAAKADGSTLEITVTDDGQGFIEADAAPPAGKRNGLGNMRQRAATIGGKLDLQSAPGQGTRVRLTVDLDGGKKPKLAGS